jgi:hypothetical protein
LIPKINNRAILVDENELSQQDDAYVIRLIYIRYLVYNYDYVNNMIMMEFESTSGMHDSVIKFCNKWAKILKVYMYRMNHEFYTELIRSNTVFDVKIRKWNFSCDNFVKIILPMLKNRKNHTSNIFI